MSAIFNNPFAVTIIIVIAIEIICFIQDEIFHKKTNETTFDNYLLFFQKIVLTL